MKVKQILFLILAFGSLSVLYFYQKSKQPVAVFGLRYERILGKNFSADTVREIKCFRQKSEDKGVRLKEKNGTWTVQSKFDAPAIHEKVDELLSALTSLEGELRSSSPAVLGDYGLDDENALHLVLMNEKGKMEEHLLIGKRGPNRNENFVRQEGNPDVFLAQDPLLARFNISEDSDQTDPSSDPWCETALWTLSQEKIERVEMIFPYRKLILEKKKLTPPSPLILRGGILPFSLSATKEWVLLEPKEMALKKEGLNKLLENLSHLTASGIVDRGNFKKYGLEKPAAQCWIKDRDGKTNRLDVGESSPEGSGICYMKVNDHDLVFKIALWKVENTLIPLSELIELPSPSWKKEEVQKISLRTGRHTLEFELKEKKWVAHPPFDKLPLYPETIETLLNTISQVKRVDRSYLNSPETLGLSDLAPTAEITLRDGSSHKLRFGKEVPLTSGHRFIQIDKAPEIWTVSRDSFQKILPSISVLFDLTLSHFKIKDVTSFTLKEGENTTVLKHTEENESLWTLEGKNQTMEYQKIGPLLSQLSNLHALDLSENPESWKEGDIGWVLSMTLPETNSIEWRISKTRERQGHLIRVGEKGLTFVVADGLVQDLKNLFQELKSAPSSADKE
ncbi:MAG: DUF4340 domain-containing protein [Chlamydiae bacterium]|nr:DUF4340 domain-containing protein [Chlamydiota bacterium]MBI3267236.1 DUF4340 domain-containing protein [Chlamydiota bacterium]